MAARSTRRSHGSGRMRLCIAAVVVSTNAHKLGVSRRTALGAGASAAFAAPAQAASDVVNFEDGTIGLRFQYPKGWRCRGTGALMGLVAGNRVTTCTDESAKDGAVVGIEARGFILGAAVARELGVGRGRDHF